MSRTWVFALTSAIALVFSPAYGRLIQLISDQAITASADLIVIAEPIETKGTEERKTILGAPVVGVETTFSITAILKGSYKAKEFRLHHYQFDGKQIEKDMKDPSRGTNYLHNPAGLVAFDQKGHGAKYLLFLRREGGNTFEPVAGQTDVFMSIKGLSRLPMQMPIYAEKEQAEKKKGGKP